MKCGILFVAFLAVGCEAPDRPMPWSIEDVSKGMQLHLGAPIERVRVLAWHDEGYVSPPIVRWQCALLWVDLKLPATAERYALVKMCKGDEKDEGWEPDTDPHRSPAMKRFKRAPASEEVVSFAREWFGPHRAGATLNDSAIRARTWKDVTGSSPTIEYRQ